MTPTVRAATGRPHSTLRSWPHAAHAAVPDHPTRSPPISSNVCETTVRVAGTEKVVRTERTSTVEHLQTTHTKAVKAAIVELRTAENSRIFRPELAAKKARNETKFPSYVDQAKARRPDPLPSRIDVPDYLVELAPGEYATGEAAGAMKVSERVDEVLPGLGVVRDREGGSRWLLRHLPSVTEERPDAHLGPVFKTRKRARTVALTELAHLDWTRPTQELLDDAVGPTVRIIKWREYIAAAKRNAWAEPNLREAEAELAATQGAPTA
ncbi:hypothetical protein [Streptomyces decoyicus]|uniref:hypothetical protein n=1 Tax=Streptomyces decoyicus TaxID=249567 RepID=UPI00364FF04B